MSKKLERKNSSRAAAPTHSDKMKSGGPQPKYLRKSIEDFEEVGRQYKGGGLTIALDTETTGLVPFTDKVTWISWAVAEDYFGVVPIAHRNPVTDRSNRARAEKVLKEILGNSSNTTIWHNAAFDLSMLIGDGWITLDEIDATQYDTMLASYVLNPVKKNEGSGHGLKELYSERLKKDQENWPDMPDFKTTCGSLKFRDVKFENASWYAGFDAWSTLQLYFQFEKDLSECPNLSHYFKKVEMQHLMTTVEIKTSGMALIKQVSIETSTTRKSILSRLDEYEWVKQRVFEILGEDFNFESPNAMRNALFYGRMNLQPLGRGDRSGKYILDKMTLVDILCEAERGLNHESCIVLAYILYAKQLSDAIQKHEEVYGNINRFTSKVQPNIAPTTTSGRYWASKPNTLSLSSSSEIKKHIVPEMGSFVVADFSQIDLRVIANETGLVNSNSKMLKDVNDGVDLHLNTLKIVNNKVGSNWKKLKKDPNNKEKVVGVDFIGGGGKTFSEEERKNLQVDQLLKSRHNVAKPINFGISYGLGAAKLMENLNTTDEFHQVILRLPRAAAGNSGVSSKQRNRDEVAWIEEIRSQLQKEHHTLEKVKGYLKKFHKTYPDIKDFQEQIEGELQTRGYSDNIFGRRCRAEIIPHMDLAQLDIKIGVDLWYRVKIKKLRSDKKGIDCLILGAHDLKVLAPKKKKFPTVSDLQFELGREVYRLDESRLSSIWAGFRAGRDTDRLIEDMMRLHAESSWDSGDLFDALPSVGPSQLIPYKINIDRPLHPYCRIQDSLIRRVLVGSREDNFVVYPGYDALRRKLISQRVSSTSMDICKIAMIESRKEFKRLWPDPAVRPRIVNCIHDEIAVECRAEDAGDVEKTLVKTMESACTYQGYLFKPSTLPVRIEVEAKIGLNYSDAKP